MVRATGRLSALQVTRAARRPGMYCDGGGLYLQVGVGGASWLYRFMLNGRAREMGLGPLALYGLSDARSLAQDARRLRHQGIDPIEHRRAARAQTRLDDAKTVTFQECAERYITSHRAGWRNAKHAEQWENSLRRLAFPLIGALPVQAIDTALVMKVLEQEMREGNKSIGLLWEARPETASRLRGRIESILSWAKARGYRAGENPARWKDHLDNLLPERSRVRKGEHYAAMPYNDVPGFLVELRQEKGIDARALEFTILTAARVSEAVGARWSEISGEVWTVPAERMKGGKEHRVPLSHRAMDLLETMPRTRDLIFPGPKFGRALNINAPRKVLIGMGHNVTVHGFRSSFRDWAAERTNFPSEAAEMALAHVVGSKVEAAYRRGDMFEKRRRLMDAWATFCTTAQETASNVAPMGRMG
jgi:integrase